MKKPLNHRFKGFLGPNEPFKVGMAGR